MEQREIIKTRNLPKWAKTQQRLEDKNWEKSFETLTFGGMDWAYAKRFTKDWEIINFNADFYKDWDYYSIVDLLPNK